MYPRHKETLLRSLYRLQYQYSIKYIDISRAKRRLGHACIYHNMVPAIQVLCYIPLFETKYGSVFPAAAGVPSLNLKKILDPMLAYRYSHNAVLIT